MLGARFGGVRRDEEDAGGFWTRAHQEHELTSNPMYSPVSAYPDTHTGVGGDLLVDIGFDPPSKEAAQTRSKSPPRRDKTESYTIPCTLNG